MSANFEDKANEMRGRAATAQDEAVRRMYLSSASTYEELAKRAGPALTASALQAAQIGALEAEVQAMRDEISVLQHALSVAVMLITRNVPAAVDDLARVQLEPSPDTPPDQVAAVRQMTQRVRELLLGGQ